MLTTRKRQSKKAQQEKARAAAEDLLPRLVGISQTLLETIDMLEAEINAASDEEVAAL